MNSNSEQGEGVASTRRATASALLHRVRMVAIAGCVVGAGILQTACTMKKIRHTVGLWGLPPAADANCVELCKRAETVQRPHQVVGVVTVHADTSFHMAKTSSVRKMKKAAASMGAKGLVGWFEAHSGYRPFLEGCVKAQGCLAVKWLGTEERRQPLDTPCVVAMLPMEDKAGVGGKRRKIEVAVHNELKVYLALKGYYLLPAASVKLRGGIDAAKALADADLKVLGGEDADLLLGVELLDQGKQNIVIGSLPTATIRVSMLDKRNRRVVFEGQATGAGALAGPHESRLAAVLAVKHVMGDLAPIGVED